MSKRESNDSEELLKIVTKLYVDWIMKVNAGKDLLEHRESIKEETFAAQILIRKMDAMNILGVDFIMPDNLVLIIDVCTGSNPGLSQIVLKELLESIVAHKGLIGKHYLITPTDFSDAFEKFPIIDDSNREEWEKKWDAQKDKNGYNLVDTLGYWKDVMKE